MVDALNNEFDQIDQAKALPTSPPTNSKTLLDIGPISKFREIELKEKGQELRKGLSAYSAQFMAAACFASCNFLHDFE